MARLTTLFFLLALALGVSCTSKYISSLELQLQVRKGLRLISTEEGSDPIWKTEDEILQLKRDHTPFVDVTDVYSTWRKLPGSRSASRLSQADKIICAFKDHDPEPQYQNELAPILANVSIPEMERNLQKLTSFNNRWFMSTSGVEASNWVYSRVQEIVDGFDRPDVTVTLFDHTWPQGSIIARIDGESDGPLTILGSHLDSVNQQDSMRGRAPGADDDGSGVVNVMEVLRSLLAAEFKPETPVEFHWYAAEEAGLRGSTEIATKYKAQGLEVQAFMQMDMTAYFKPGTEEVIALLPDYVDSDLNEYVKTLITEYNRIPWAMEEPCGYSCSDHFSWDMHDYPTVFPFEAVTGDYNPRMHTTDDTAQLRGFSWEHSLEFAKLAVAFVYELSASAEWRSR
ncbi:aminopeptidase [Coprinopsis marcescibilis]|uniref:Peptide hydrolase n=1 Tax=Coprinopsis marcescibilis TaxID=230819 RepID=A0A5C3LA53_COPMA|nr:aminopeptidase [Coprinopsis marcescibilis]